jgi:uncharacterized membrane protein
MSSVSHASTIENMVRGPRIAAVDVARGAALVAMAIYHFCWNLEMFGYLAPGTANSGFLKVFARSIATSFLFLVGFSLVLATANGFRLGDYAKRLAIVAGAAGLISAVTYLATPDAWIFFGILHHIAALSIIGLLFVGAPWWLCLLLAGLALALPQLGLVVTQSPWLSFIGLYAVPPVSSDFVPLFPWLGAGLAGIAAARLALDHNQITGLGTYQAKTKAAAALRFLGRHSLAFYLIHQPVLIGLVWGFTRLAR